MPEYVVTRVQTWRLICPNDDDYFDAEEMEQIAIAAADTGDHEPDTEDWQVEEVKENR